MIQQMTASYAAGTAPDTWTTAPTIYHEYVRAGNLLQLNDLIKRDVDPKKHFMETMPEWESPAASGKYFGLTRDFVGHHPLLQQEPARRRPGALPGRRAGPTTP